MELMIVAMGCFAFAAGFIFQKIRSKRDIEGLQSIIDVCRKQLADCDKKSKMSENVLMALNELQQGGVVLHVERIDKNDIFFHNGSQYR